MKQENNSTTNRRSRTPPVLFSHSTTTTTSQSRRLKSNLSSSSSYSKTNNNNNNNIIYNKKELQEEEDKEGVSVPKTTTTSAAASRIHTSSSSSSSSSSRRRRSSSPLVPNKPKSSVPSPTPKKDSINSSSGCRRSPPPPPPIVDQFSRPRRISTSTTTTDRDPHKSTTTTTSQLLHPDPNNNNNKLLLLLLEELQEKLALSEIEIKNLQSQVLSLKSDLDKAHSLNSHLTLHLPPPLAVAAAARSNFQPLTDLHHQLKEESNSEYQTPSFKDIQKLIANKLQHPILNQKVATSEPTSTSKSSLTSPLLHPISIPTDEHRKLPVPVVNPAGPPPPPPPPRPPARSTTTRKAPAFVEFYHSLTKREGKNQSPGLAIHNKPVATSAHSSIVGEIENRSAHLMAIKADIETKGEFINGLIQKVLAAAYIDIEDVLKFADWLDNELSSLADERAVLKHFKWPERKADAMREAAIEYRELKVLEREISSYKDDTHLPCGAALKKIASLLDKSERSIQRLIKLRNSVMLNYQDYKIPTDWMLDSGIVRKIKQTSMKLAKMYMNRVTIELESVRNIERESAQEALMLQGVHFAYRTHQFAGGLDPETLCALEEIIRQRVPGQQQGGSRELLAGIGIPSS